VIDYLHQCFILLSTGSIFGWSIAPLFGVWWLYGDIAVASFVAIDPAKAVLVKDITVRFLFSM